jgi:hypothetical protein
MIIVNYMQMFKKYLICIKRQDMLFLTSKKADNNQNK